jgi:uncharacterized protein
VIFLLDVNLLMALLWENHEHHQTARAWLRHSSKFATCPLTQLGFARISSHAMLGYGMSPEQAFQVLRGLLSDTRHRFIPDDLSCADRILRTDLIGTANQVSDYYLIALARQHGLALATFDVALAKAFHSEHTLVKLVS